MARHDKFELLTKILLERGLCRQINKISLACLFIELVPQTLSSVDIRVLNTNSHTPIISAKKDPTTRTTKTPPRFFRPNLVNGGAGFATHWPPPLCFHQRSLSNCSTPVSCNFSIASDNGARSFEPSRKKKLH